MFLSPIALLSDSARLRTVFPSGIAARLGAVAGYVIITLTVDELIVIQSTRVSHASHLVTLCGRLVAQRGSTAIYLLTFEPIVRSLRRGRPTVPPPAAGVNPLNGGIRTLQRATRRRFLARNGRGLGDDFVLRDPRNRLPISPNFDSF